MPIITSDYRPNRVWLRNPHVSSILPAVLRRVKRPPFEREVLELPDGDFLDLDWVRTEKKADRLAIVLHGLEGAADRPYVQGMCRQFVENGWDALAPNQRTCSGRMNRLPRAYHMGVTDDLALVVERCIELGYTEIGLVGFSMGGNHVLKYLGEMAGRTPTEIIGGVAFSVPCHIPSANVEFNRFRNKLYLGRFLMGLNEKVRLKALQFPEMEVFKQSGKLPRSFTEFDELYTAPIHGFDCSLLSSNP